MILVALLRMRIKLILLWSFIFRAYDICSTYFSFHFELSPIKGFLKGNSFPIFLNENIIKSFLDNIFSSVGNNTRINEDTLALVFNTPSLDPSSLHLESRISRLI